MKIETIFLDVDEVLAQWVVAALRALDGFAGYSGAGDPRLQPAAVFAAWDALLPRPWDLCEVIPHTRVAMWQAIHACDAGFWKGLDLYPWAMELYQRCSAVAPVVLLTSPSKDPSSYAGKAAWVQRHFPDAEHLIGSCKHRVAHPGAVLIDDSPKNCAAFREAGGHAILFPGVGNDLHALIAGHRVAYVARALQVIVESTPPRTDLYAVFAAAFGNNELTPEQKAEAWGRATPAARAQWLRDEIDVVALYRSGDA